MRAFSPLGVATVLDLNVRTNDTVVILGPLGSGCSSRLGGPRVEHGATACPLQTVRSPSVRVPNLGRPEPEHPPNPEETVMAQPDEQARRKADQKAAKAAEKAARPPEVDEAEETETPATTETTEVVETTQVTETTDPAA